MTEETKKEQPSWVSKFNLLLIVALGLGTGFYLYEQNKSISSLENQVKNLSETVSQSEKRVNKINESVNGIIWKNLTEQSKKMVDFSDSSIQTLNEAFLLVNAAQKEHLTGIKFTGRVINTQSVKHQNVTFKITVSDISKKFTINQISSGNSTGFSVYIPDLTAEKARYAKFEYLSSTISYYK